MKKITSLVLGFLVLGLLCACASPPAASPDSQKQLLDADALAQGGLASDSPAGAEGDAGAVSDVVTNFGQALKSVSLLSPDAADEMAQNYGDFVTPELLEKWQADPDNAPGRLTSSPWPDRIEIDSTDRLSDDQYEVAGKIIELTSVEVENGAAAARRAVTLTVTRSGDQWLISDVALGDYLPDPDA